MSQHEYIPPELRRDIAEGDAALNRINHLRQIQAHQRAHKGPRDRIYTGAAGDGNLDNPANWKPRDTTGTSSTTRAFGGKPKRKRRR